MPFFIRARQLDIPTPTISTVASDDEDNFITDPEQFFDELPQPFRFLNKIVNKVIESAWDKISQREREKEAEAKCIKPPTYTPSSNLENYGNITCIFLTKTGIMFLSLGNCLKAVKTDTKEEIACWKPEEEICVEKISSICAEGMHLLSVIDDMGFAQLIVYETGTFHHITTLNELVEGMPKSNAVHMEVSADGQFCGVTLESNHSSTIEFYKIPLSTWAKEIDAVRKEHMKKVESVMAANEGVDNQDLPSDIELPPVKFSPISPVLKVNELTQITGNSGKTPQQLLETVNYGEVIGDGNFHIFSDDALNIQDKLFYTINERDLIYAEEEKHVTSFKPKFQFLKKSLMESPGQIKTDASYIFVGVWWTNYHNYHVYSLTKSSKNIELSPDAVWPQCADITCCSMACNSMLFAIGLSNGVLTLWDRKLGVVKNVLMISKNVPVISIDFLITENPNQDSFSFQNKDIQLLVGSKNGQICKVICGKQLSCTVIAEGNGVGYDHLIPIKKLPEIFFSVHKDGSMAIRSTEKNEILCHLSLPDGIQYEDPYHNSCIIDAEGEILYIKGASPSSSVENKVVLFHLRSFPTLDKFRICDSPEESYKDTTFDESVQKLLSLRMRKQAARTEKLVKRWHELDKQLETVMHLRESLAVAQRETVFSRQSTPAANWSRSTSRIMEHNQQLQTL